VKGVRYLTIVLVIVTLVAATSWLLRNRIAEQLSGPTLANYGLKITDVSLDALARRGASIGRLVLEYENGMTIRVQGLQLPLTASGTGDTEYAATSVEIFGGGSTSDTRADVATWLDDILALPGELPHTTIHIDTLAIEEFPELHDVRWHADSDSQTLDLTEEDHRLSLQIYATAAGKYNALIQLQGTGADFAPQTLEMRIGMEPAVTTIDSTATVEPESWLRLLRNLRLMPAADVLSIDAGTAGLEFTVAVPRALDLPISLNAVIHPAAQSSIEYRNAAGDRTIFRNGSSAAFTLETSYPTLDWTLANEHSDVTISSGALSGIVVTINHLACHSGITCSLASRVELDRPETPYGAAGKLVLDAESSWSIGEEGMQVRVLPGATLVVSDYMLGRTKIAQLELDSAASIDVVVDDTGLRVAADSLDARVSELTMSEGSRLSMPVFAENIRAEMSGDRRATSAGIYIPAMNAAVAGLDIALPGLRGTVQLEGRLLAAQLSTVGLAGEAAVDVHHDLETGSGSLDLGGAKLSFKKQPLASRIAPRQKTWNLSDGELLVDAQVQWRAGPDESLHAEATLGSASIAGFFANVAFGGLDTSLDLSYDAAGDLVLQPSTLSLGFIDPGFPVTNLSADYHLDLAHRSVQVDNLHMEAFGGVILADPFSFRTGDESNHLILHAQSLDLARMLSVEEFEAMEISGRVSAELPLTITGTDVAIEGGHLTGDAPGGVIRYKAGAMSDPGNTSGIGIATQALSNFVYDALTSDVNYGADGNLVLKMRLTGRNPDMDSTRPIVLNLGLENNVRQMLRSLQAARHVEDVLKKRLEQQ